VARAAKELQEEMAAVGQGEPKAEMEAMGELAE
jgi:hypothetical protein